MSSRIPKREFLNCFFNGVAFIHFHMCGKWANQHFKTAVEGKRKDFVTSGSKNTQFRKTILCQ
jgi:hypothetical protein